MPNYGTWLTLCILFHCWLVLVKSDCVLYFPLDRRNAPTYEKSFGTRRIKIPFMHGQVRLEEFDNITGICATYFSEFLYKLSDDEVDSQYGSSLYPSEKRVPGLPNDTGVAREKRRISVNCFNGKLKYEGNEVVTQQLSCAPLKWSIFESKRPLLWCAANSGYYILGSKSLASDLILAAACFDVEKTALQSVRYYVGPKPSMNSYLDLIALVPKGFTQLAISLEIKNFNTTFSHMRESELNRRISRQHSLWLQLANYEQHSLIQGGPYAEFFSQFGLFLNTIWWPNLRLGNWRSFFNVLYERANNNGRSYDLYSGTSGTVTTPLIGKLGENNPQELKIGSMNRSVPAYIWTYVAATDGTEEFVIVGYNSPFYEFFNKEKIIFCPNICAKIDWLQEASTTFHYATMGILFCCNVDDVRNNNYLDGFPQKEVKEIPTITPVPKLTTARYMKSSSKINYNGRPKPISHRVDNDEDDD